MTRHISPARQAQIRGMGSYPVQTSDLRQVEVVAQNIVLARIDVKEDGRDRKVVLNLYGERDINNLIEALRAARTRIREEKAMLDQIRRESPELFAAA
jgi:ribosome-binding factor A